MREGGGIGGCCMHEYAVGCDALDRSTKTVFVNIRGNAANTKSEEATFVPL